MLDKVNRERAGHRHHRGPGRVPAQPKKCIVNQRELHADTTASPTPALRPAPDPDVVLIGEGARLRRNRVGAAHRRDRPPHLRHPAHQLRRADDQPHRRHLPAHQQGQIRCSCRSCSRGSSQSLLPRRPPEGPGAGDGDPGAQRRDPQPHPRDKVHQIYGMMQTGQAKYGMQTFNQASPRSLQAHDHACRPRSTDRPDPEELQEIISRGGPQPQHDRAGPGAPVARES